MLVGSAVAAAAVLAMPVAANAAPASSAETQPVSTRTSADGPIGAQASYIVGGTYISFGDCERARRAQPGPAAHPSYCLPSGGIYVLMIWV
ncbi:hypothetical protein AB0L14_34555 [Streptomyces sp. NPDC052727]|uniref:hypothetical protein n=1 Tax=Streptomyces sp. NPDC052727 TaxID=3154854 RepID=UPI0034431B26